MENRLRVPQFFFGGCGGRGGRRAGRGRAGRSQAPEGGTWPEGGASCSSIGCRLRSCSLQIKHVLIGRISGVGFRSHARGTRPETGDKGCGMSRGWKARPIRHPSNCQRMENRSVHFLFLFSIVLQLCSPGEERYTGYWSRVFIVMLAVEIAGKRYSLHTNCTGNSSEHADSTCEKNNRKYSIADWDAP